MFLWCDFLIALCLLQVSSVIRFYSIRIYPFTCIFKFFFLVFGFQSISLLSFFSLIFFVVDYDDLKVFFLASKL